ncbi:CoA-binding protein [Okeania sp. KiyG1]|uniref:succinate--CoA ligase subunit alpha n=1 Tax=Okeania sp. KiyG1 TaxID=2720165 RepID=UPI0019229B70|nr:CoA-binding protein [Okeania sp. KiyG1]GGA15680.1 succinate--CoA ligase [ADP-forming] subunit alpha [Okeania sp. KiyG1]
MNLTPDSKVIVQGATEKMSTQIALMMKSYGTNVVAGISPGEGGQEWSGIPVFNLVEEAVAKVGIIDTTLIVVPAYQVLDASLEAIASGIKQIVIVTEGVPPLDMVQLLRKAEATETLIVGPNCAGIIVPDKLLLGTHPTQFYTPGPVGIISRSNTLTYEVAWELTKSRLGQSICVSIGCDPIVGSSFLQWLQILDEDDRTELIVLVGEVGGASEEIAASYISETIDKPVVAYIAGIYAPINQNYTHASSLINARNSRIKHNFHDRMKSKIAAFKEFKIPVAKRPSEIPSLVKYSLEKKYV